MAVATVIKTIIIVCIRVLFVLLLFSEQKNTHGVKALTLRSVRASTSNEHQTFGCFRLSMCVRVENGMMEA